MKCLIEELNQLDILPWGWVMLRRTPNTDPNDGFIEIRFTGDVNLIKENATLQNQLSVAMSENQRLTKHVEDYEAENAALKRESIWTGKRIEIRRGDSWLREGHKGTAVGEPVFVQQNWLPVLWDDEEDPIFSKLAAIALLTAEEQIPEFAGGTVPTYFSEQDREETSE